MAAIINPFPVSAYHGADLFATGIKNKKIAVKYSKRVITTLFSIMRMGKAGLLYHLFDKVKHKLNSYCL